MNEANEDNLASNQAHRARSFKVVTEKADTIYLNEEEIQALYNLQIEDDRMRRIRDLFVLNCQTGLRHSDWSKVILSNF